MKKICVSTYCELTSYGSVLQAYALKRHLDALGCEVSHIKFDKNYQDGTQIYYKGKNIKIFLINMGRFLKRKQIRRRYESTLRFFYENFNFIRYADYEELKSNPPEADLYIAGSDQVWNPLAMKPFFFLDFVKNPSNIILNQIYFDSQKTIILRFADGTEKKCFAAGNENLRSIAYVAWRAYNDTNYSYTDTQMERLRLLSLPYMEESDNMGSLNDWLAGLDKDNFGSLEDWLLNAGK